MVLSLLVWGAVVSGAFQPPPPPTRWVTDTAGFISEDTRRALDARLQQYERDTGRQVVVWIGQSTGDEPLESWAVRTFDAWNLGRAGEDDGVAIFVFAQDRKLRIEVGYGLEGDLPDAYASRIIQETAVPRLRAGDPDGAIDATVSAVLSRLGGETSPPPAATRPPAPYSGGQRSQGPPIMLIVVGVLFVILFITNPRLAMFLLYSILMSGGGSRRGGGWGGGGGGGFSGGGGRSGGGGASGSW